MNYLVEIDERARKQGLSLPKAVLDRVLTALARLEEYPRPLGAIKLQGRKGWRIRVGDYRILYTIDDAARVVRVYRIAHRREVYR